MGIMIHVAIYTAYLTHPYKYEVQPKTNQSIAKFKFRTWGGVPFKH